MLTPTRSFKARSADGREFTITVYGHHVDAGSHHAPATSHGMQLLRTEDGMTVMRIDKGAYQIVGLGLQITSSDPSAP